MNLKRVTLITIEESSEPFMTRAEIIHIKISDLILKFMHFVELH